MDVKPNLLLRYAVDKFVIIKRCELQWTFIVINGVFAEIKFTTKAEHGNILPFLDVIVTCTDTGTLRTSVHSKSRYINQILRFLSSHSNFRKASFKKNNLIAALRSEENKRASVSQVSAQRLHKKLYWTKHQQKPVPRDHRLTNQNANHPAVHQAYLRNEISTPKALWNSSVSRAKCKP